MPHECTNCGRGFPDGSKEMLSGCPDCGGTKFQFSPAGTSRERSSATSDDDQPTDGASRADRRTSDRRGSSRESSGERSARASSHEFGEWPETARPPADRDERSDTGSPTGRKRTDHGDGSSDTDFEWISDDEDDAQASARSDVVSPDELPASTGTDADQPGPAADQPGPAADEPPEHGRVVSEPAEERPSLEELRDELNDQFESIKIVQPGQYELNLMELYDREEQIVSLQEDGRYVINVPDSWRESDDE